MAQSIQTEPTLSEVLAAITELKTDVDELKTDVEKFNDRFADYRQATQWVVQLAFTLIASATITVIVSSVLR
jgi:cell division protein FtsX